LDTAWKQFDSEELSKVHHAYYNCITRVKFRAFIASTDKEPEEFADWIPFDKANHCLSVMQDMDFS